jgi:hypothetical protein
MKIIPLEVTDNFEVARGVSDTSAAESTVLKCCAVVDNKKYATAVKINFM